MKFDILWLMFTGETDKISNEDFFRAEAHSYVLKRITQGESFLVIGIPGVGISSFLRVLQLRLTDQHKILNTLIDLNELIDVEQESVLATLTKQLEHHINPEKPTDIFGLAELAAAKDDRYVVIIDRFEKAITQSPSGLFDNLRAVALKSGRKIIFIFGASSNPEIIWQNEKTKPLNTLVGHHTYYLQPLNPKEALHLIQRRAQLNSLELKTTESNLLILETGGHIRLINAYLDHLAQQPDQKINAAFFKSVSQIPHIKFIYRTIFDFLTDAQHTALTRTASKQSLEKQDHENLYYLKQCGLVSSNETIFSLGFERYLIEQTHPDEGLQFDEKTGEIFKNGQRIDQQLSSNEYKLLMLLYRHVDQVVERDKIVEEVWADKLNSAVSEEAIDQLVSRLREKIEDNKSNPRYLQTIRGRGFQFKTSV